jgi:predicted amidohydrolase YtcJ
MRSRIVLAVATACVVAAMLPSLRVVAQTSGMPVPYVPDTVLYGGKVVTVDDASFTSNVGTIAEAIAVRGTDIMAVGTTAQVRALAGPSTKQVDLKGRTVLPSFTLTHEHPTDWAWSEPEAMRHVFGNGMDFLQMRWLTGTAKEQFASWESVLRDMVAKSKPGQWIWLSFSLGANLENAEEIFAEFDNIVTPAKVNALTPNNPARVKRGWPLNTIENTKALELIKKYYPEMDFTAADRAREATPRIVEPDVIMRGHRKELADLLKAEMQLWVAHGVTAARCPPGSAGPTRGRIFTRASFDTSRRSSIPAVPICSTSARGSMKGGIAARRPLPRR